MDRIHGHFRLWLVVWFVIAMATQVGQAVSEQPAAQQDAVTLTLTADDNGRTISGRVGDQVAIQLKENPTTGYVWTVAPSLRHVTLVATRFTPAESGLLGAGGTRVFAFRLDTPGEVLIRTAVEAELGGRGTFGRALQRLNQDQRRGRAIASDRTRPARSI